MDASEPPDVDRDPDFFFFFALFTQVDKFGTFLYLERGLTSMLALLSQLKILSVIENIEV